MALNLQTFKTRTLTAIVFAAVMLVGLLWNFWSFLILFTIIHFGCWYEYFKLIEKINSVKIDAIIKSMFYTTGLIALYYAAFPQYSFDFGIVIAGKQIGLKYLLLGFLLLLLIIFSIQNKNVPIRAKLMSFLGLLYITMPVLMMIDLRQTFNEFEGYKYLQDTGLSIPLCIIFSIWINDTMAYIVGSLIGKTPFSKISPKKTWEGTIGGAILCVIVIGFLYPLLMGKYLHPLILTKTWFIIPAICAIFGTLGDLLESKLKRMANVKDSGSIMPGHGGFLDRFDSLLIATPFVWLYVKLFLN